MKVTEINVTAGRTLPHPTESYANLRPTISLSATLEEGDEPQECIRKLQVQAEQLVEDHAAALVASIAERELAERELAEIGRLTQSIETAQGSLQRMRERRDERKETASRFLPIFESGETTTPDA